MNIIISGVCFCSSSEAKPRDSSEHSWSLGRSEFSYGNANRYFADEQPEQNTPASGRGHAANGPSRPGLLPETKVPFETSEFQSE